MNLRELAAHLNLSQTTVSRALNGYPEVGEETRRRVALAAERFDYRPNAHARRLATGKSHAIGHVLATDRSLVIDPHFSDFMAGAGEVYGARGYDIILTVPGPEGEAEVYRRYARRGGVDAVVLHGPRLVDDRLALLESLGLPFIVHGRAGASERGYAWLDIDNRGAFRQATRLLIDLGHRRIALLNGPETLTFAAHRRQGHDEALTAAGLSPSVDLLTSGPMTEEQGYRATQRMLALAHPPTTFLCSSILLASGAIRAIHEAGLAIGPDVSLVAHDDGISFLRAEGLSPPLTVTRSSIRDAGARIANLLLDRIAAPTAEPPHELWPVDLVVRGSTAPPPARAQRRRA